MSDPKIGELEQRLRQLLRTNQLSLAPRHIYGGTATGDETCTICGLAIAKGQVMFEFDVEEDERRKTLCTHSACYNVWHQESVRERLRRLNEPL